MKIQLEGGKRVNEARAEEVQENNQNNPLIVQDQPPPRQRATIEV